MGQYRDSESTLPSAKKDSDPALIRAPAESDLLSYEESLAQERQLRKSAEEELQAEMQFSARLHQLGTRLLAKMELSSLLDEVLEGTISIQNSDFGCLQIYNPLTRSLQIVAQRGLGSDFLKHFDDCREETTICGHSLLHRERVVVPDVSLDSVFLTDQEAAVSAGYRAIQATPLISHKSESLGVISTYFREPHRPSERELRFTDRYVHFAAELIERQRMEDVLRRNEERLVQAEKLSHTGTWTLNIATGNLWWSEEHYRILGLDPQTTSPSYPRAIQVVHPLDRGFVQAALEKSIRECSRFEVECRIVQPSGGVRNVLSIADPVFDHAGILMEYAGRIIDRTDRRRAEEAQRRLAALVQNSMDFIGFADLNGQPLFVNPAGCKFAGLDCEEDFKRTSMADYVIEEDRDLLAGGVKTASEIGHWKAEVRFRNLKTKAVIPMLQHIFVVQDPETGQRIGLATISRDNSEQKRAEEKLRDSENRFRQLADSIPHHVWSVTRNGTAGYCNRRWLEYTGLSAEESQGGGWPAVHPEDFEQVNAAWQAVWEHGAAIEVEQRIRGRDGTYRRFVCRGVAIQDEQGRTVECFGTNTDVEERRHAQAALHKLQSELAHAARASSMGELAVSIAHEVNQPLNAILINTDACSRLLDRQFPPIGEIRQAVREIADSGRRAAEVVSRIRAAVTEARSGHSLVDTNDLIEEVLDSMEVDLANHQVSLHTTLQEGLPAVKGSRVELQQVLINLISNGMEAMVNVRDRPRNMWVHSSHSEAGVLVSVRDSGMGLDLIKIARIFEPFYTTKTTGMGMGLAISRFIIQAHGGRIWASGAEPCGAIFQFLLPCASEEVQHA
jgi:PAS domain S-box-containing protein